MDGSGPGLDFSSPNCRAGGRIEAVSFKRLTRDERLPLPTGHPLSWGVLTLGTLLEGSAYIDGV